MATRSLRQRDWDDEVEELDTARIVRFPDRAFDKAQIEDNEPDPSGGPVHPRRRRGRQAARPDSMLRSVVTVGAILLAVVALWYLLMQLGQLGGQSPAPQAGAATAGAAAQAVPGAPAQPPAAPAPARGEGPLRATSRVLEPSYTVQPGDTLGTIATKFGTNVEALQSINNLADRNVLSVGQKLVIPNQE